MSVSNVSVHSKREILDILSKVLKNSPYTRNCSISLFDSSSEIIVKGLVRSFYEKQMIQEELLRFFKKHDLDLILQNEIVVKS